MDGDTLACQGKDIRQVPASNMKLITTGSALRALGPDFRFETSLGYSGQIEAGVLKGDLYILGGADPTTGSRTDCAERTDSLFARWRNIILDAGIIQIDGCIVGDPRYLDGLQDNLGASFEDFGFSYGAVPSGLNFFQNIQLFRVAPGPVVGSRPNIMPSYPDTPWMQYSNCAKTGPARTSDEVVYINTCFGPYGEFCGSYPIDRRRVTEEYTNRFGAYTLAYYFSRYLGNHGIRVSGRYADISPVGEIREDLSRPVGRPAARLDSIRVIGSTQSPRLGDLVFDTNVHSDNFYAETLLRMLGKKRFGSAQIDSCLVAEAEVLRSMGLDPDRMHIVDGSGLSRKNYVSPDFFVRFLRAMTRTDVWEDYLNSLPVPGCDGTLEYIMRDAPEAVKSRIHMKGGSMNGVRCYSGYILSPGGAPSQTIAFSILTSNMTVPSSAVINLTDRIILSLADEN